MNAFNEIVRGLGKMSFDPQTYAKQRKAILMMEI